MQTKVNSCSSSWPPVYCELTKLDSTAIMSSDADAAAVANSTESSGGGGGDEKMAQNVKQEAPKSSTSAAPEAENDIPTVILPGNERIRRSKCAPNDADYMETYYEGVKTVYDAFKRGLKVSNNGEFLGTRKDGESGYEWVRYQEAYDRGHQLACGLLSLGTHPGQNTYVGIYSKNRVEWVLSDIACMSQSMISVPLYDTLGAKASSYIINEAQISVVICEDSKKARTLLDDNLCGECLKFIIIMEYEAEQVDQNKELLESAHKCGVQLKSFNDVIEAGKNNPKDPQPPEPDDLFTVSYTSGTTGDPKGVMLSHKNLISIVSSVAMQWSETGKDISVTPDDVAISYLPLAHMFERNLMIILYTDGAKSGFFRGEVPKLFEDIKALQPTIIPFVPRVLNKLYDKTEAEVRGSWLKSWLLKRAIISKNAQYNKGVIERNGLWDKLMLRKFRDAVGATKLRLALTGSAPISNTIMSFSRAALGCVLLEGYGQTEATTAITFTLPTNTSLGNVGAVVPCCHVKLVDVPDLNYLAKNDEGEVCVRGSNVSRGYLNKPEQTSAVLDSDGWLHTGDVGKWLPNGTLQIVDRIKHIFKLSQGEYLAPEKIENVYLGCELVAQIFVDGNSLQNYCVGIVVPDPNVLPKWAAEQYEELRDSHDFSQLCDNQRVREGILQAMTATAKQGGLKSFEQVKKIYVSSEPFGQGLITPTLKNKRPALRQHFKTHIDNMYNDTN